MHVSIIPLAHSMSPTPLTYQWGDIFSHELPPVWSLVEITVGKHQEYGIYVWIYDGTLPGGEIKHVERIVSKRTIIEPYQIEIIQSIAATYFLPIHRVLGFFLSRPLMKRLEKYGYDALLGVEMAHYPIGTHQRELTVAASGITPETIRKYTTAGTIVICPDDFYLFSLAETISDEGTFFLPAEATETQKVKAWIDTYQGKYPKIFWTRRILYYNLARYTKILYLEDAFQWEYMHYPTKIHYLDVLAQLGKNTSMDIQILTTNPLLTTLQKFRDFELINLP